MAPPATPPGAAKPVSLLKRIPPWGWAIGAGGVLGLGYTLYRGRREPNVAGPPAGEADLADDYTLATQPSPGGAYYPSSPIIAEPAETVGAIGQTALETAIGGITGIVETLPALLSSVPQPDVWDPTELITSLAQGNQLPVTPAPAPTPIPQPASPPAATPPKGVTILGRKFPNAVSYQERNHPGRGKTFDVYFTTRVERWETWMTDPATFGNATNPGGTRKWKKISTRNR